MYTIKIVPSKEFDSLPQSVTRGSKIDDSLGFADPATNTAYVRHSSWPELNSYLISHEMEHLLEDRKTDMDENGICHKKAGKFWEQVLAPAIFPIFNPVVTGQEDPWQKSGENALAAGGGMITGGPVGGVVAGYQSAADQARNPEAKSDLSFKSGIGDIWGGAQAGQDPWDTGIKTAAKSAFGDYDARSSYRQGYDTGYGPSQNYGVDQVSPQGFDASQLGNMGNAYGGTFTGQSAQTPSGMGPGAGGGNIGIMNTGLNQGGISLGAQNTLGDNLSYGGFNNMFNGMSF